jgi:MinD-like ATPase involved in chromosome partitioning or flagellar assembly
VAVIISVHSFRGGTGKSNTTANLAATLAQRGRRVGVIDTDIQSPGIHILFGLDGNSITASLNDYLWGGRRIEEAAHDVTPDGHAGNVFLIPSSIKPGEITRVLREGYDAQRLTVGLRQLVDELQLDILLIDTHPGLNEETLLSLVISHALVIVMRPDKQDYEGTGITIKVAQGLQVPKMMLVVNKVPDAFDLAGVKANVERAYGVEVAAVLPHSDEMMTLASEGIFAVRFPDHPLTDLYRQVADRVLPA